MFNDNYNVVIIGAGPSGASCAYNLKRFAPQLSVLLIDKAKFPRYKPCGGGISPEVANYFDFDLAEGIDFHCNQFEMISNGKSTISNEHALWMVRREKFDDFLVTKAKEKGVIVVTECEVIAIEELSTESIVKTNVGNFKAKLVVLAEGSRGTLAKKLGIAPKNKTIAAMEYEHGTTNLTGILSIDADNIDTGYSWNFPKSDGLSLGVGAFLKTKRKKTNIKLPGILKQYVKQYEVDNLESKNTHGHPIQLYSGHKKLVHGRTILIGEIAGCVDPLTAEGIRPAIKSGYLAAKAVAKALSKNKLKKLKRYEKSFHQKIGKDFRYAKFLSYFLFSHKSKVLSLISPRRAMDEFMHVFSGQSTYRDKVSFKRIFRLTYRMFFRNMPRGIF